MLSKLVIQVNWSSFDFVFVKILDRVEGHKRKVMNTMWHGSSFYK